MYLIIFVFAFIFRFILFDQGILVSNIITSDSDEYLHIAKSIDETGVYGIDGSMDMNRTPTYPFLIYIINQISGYNINFIVYIQIFIDSLSCCLIFSIGNKFLIKKYSKVILTLLIVTCLYTSAYSMMIMTETLYSFLIILSLFFITNINNSKDYIYKIPLKINLITSILFVLIVLTRPIFTLTIIFFFIMIFLTIITTETNKIFLNFKKMFITGLLMIIFISPWVTRNLIFFNDDIFSKNSIATPLGYKTNYNMWKHFYLDEFRNFLKSYEEPFLLLNPAEPPVFAKYIYQNEKKDIENAFRNLNKTKNFMVERGGKQLDFSEETKKSFAEIAKKRYEMKPELYLTAPLSRIIKIIFAPRIATFGSNDSGFVSNKSKLIIFLIYNFLYVALALLFFLKFKNFHKDKLFYIFTLSLITSHIYAYTIWIPNPQSRYLIPIFPVFALLTVISFENLSSFFAKKFK